MNQTYQIIPHSFGEPEYREIKEYTVKFVGRSLLFQSSRFGMVVEIQKQRKRAPRALSLTRTLTLARAFFMISLNWKIQKPFSKK